MIPVKNILIIALFVFMMDQLTKLVVIHYMDLSGLLYIKFLPPIMNFKMAWNEGINFGLFAS
ncbi:MAG: signal peptidase II, partial [Acidimicrobiales bacterium]|nr:signal peptidase II [Acidimicrobiales bacterium]